MTVSVPPNISETVNGGNSSEGHIQALPSARSVRPVINNQKGFSLPDLGNGPVGTSDCVLGSLLRPEL